MKNEELMNQILDVCKIDKNIFERNHFFTYFYTVKKRKNFSHFYTDLIKWQRLEHLTYWEKTNDYKNELSTGYPTCRAGPAAGWGDTGGRWSPSLGSPGAPSPWAWRPWGWPLAGNGRSESHSPRQTAAGTASVDKEHQNYRSLSSKQRTLEIP